MSGTPYDFLVSELFIPETSSSGRETGVDLNGDGLIDNKLGIIVSLVGAQFSGFDLNAHLNTEIAAGRLLLVVRLLVDQLGNDDAILVLLSRAVMMDDATPLFDGGDIVALDPTPESPQDRFLCGSLENDYFMVGPAAIALSVPLPELGTLDLLLERAQIYGGAVTADRIEEIIVGGGLSTQEISTRIYPLMLEWMQGELATAPTGPLAADILDSYDDHCVHTPAPNCYPIPSGCAPDGQILPDEVRCNDLLGAAFRPDLDVDRDGVRDLVSIGFKIISAVPVTVIDTP